MALFIVIGKQLVRSLEIYRVINKTVLFFSYICHNLTEVNRRDYRAWYGLGQTYEILKMPFYGLYYYKQAQLLRPHDSRMVLALGEAYEKQDKIQDALKCYYKACNVGDIEGMALLKLATYVSVTIKYTLLMSKYKTTYLI